MKNLVQALMQDHPATWLEILEKDFKIIAARDGDLVSLKYDQIESPLHEPVVQQCRGMVVDTALREVLAWGYNKFWNLGESLAAPMDWSTAQVFDKLDGSLMQLYWHKGEWRVASSGHPTAGGSFGAEPHTFADAFWRLFKALGYTLPSLAWADITWLLELCDTPNRVVVRHTKPRLVLHGGRNIHTGQEIAYEKLRNAAALWGWELVTSFPLKSAEECLQAAAHLDPIQQEGFVVVDAAFNRVKIKSPRYVLLHHMKDKTTPRNAIALWQTGEASELLAQFPELASTILPIHAQLEALAQRAADAHAEAMRRSTDRKSYATLATQQPFSAVMFRMLTEGSAGTAAASAIMRKMHLSALESLLTFA